MLSVNQIINNLINEFNKVGDVLFMVSPNEQQFYDNNVLDLDGNHYIGGVITEVPMPRVENFYQTRQREFNIQIKGVQSLLDDVNDIVNQSLLFKLDNVTYVLSNLIVDDVITQNDGKKGKVKVFYGTLRLGVQIPSVVVNNQVKYKIDGVEVDVIGGDDIFDKALISSVEFGNNLSDINTGQEQSFTFTVGSNAKVDEIFVSVLNRTYNKTFTFEIDYVVASITAELVLRRGLIRRATNTQPLQFTAVFSRALPRQQIKINGVDMVAISFNPQQTIVPIPVTRNGRTKQRAVQTSNTYNFYLENNQSALIGEMIDEFREHTNKKFTLEFMLNDKLVVEDCIITNMLFSSSENTTPVINVTLGEGVFNDN